MSICIGQRNGAAFGVWNGDIARSLWPLSILRFVLSYNRPNWDISTQTRCSYRNPERAQMPHQLTPIVSEPPIPVTVLVDRSESAYSKSVEEKRLDIPAEIEGHQPPDS
jgi:hypothetical protein